MTKVAYELSSWSLSCGYKLALAECKYNLNHDFLSKVVPNVQLEKKYSENLRKFKKSESIIHFILHFIYFYKHRCRFSVGTNHILFSGRDAVALSFYKHRCRFSVGTNHILFSGRDAVALSFYKHRCRFSVGTNHILFSGRDAVALYFC